MLFGLLRLSRYITLVPYSVVPGFMSGIGVIILVLQIGPFLGISTRGGVVESLRTLTDGFQPNGAALAVGVVALAIVFLSPKTLTRLLPSPLLALLTITPLSLALFSDARLQAMDLTALPRIEAIS